MSRYVLTAEEEADYRRARRVITPSTVGREYWEGHWRDGETFSVEQLRELGRLGIAADVVDRLDVFAPGDPRRIHGLRRPGVFFVPITYFHRRLTCPVVGSVRDRLKVISPNGAMKLVYPNGELARKRVAA